jgi:hypothetical protein
MTDVIEECEGFYMNLCFYWYGHIYKPYITTVVLYGMELLVPSSKPLEHLELFQKRVLKQILSLSMSCLDPTVYILTGILPIEAQIHIKALTSE